MLTALLLLQLASLPDPTLTPGAIRPLSKEQVCHTTWGTDRRFVTERMKKQVAAAYGLPWSEHSSREFDHVVPRSLGGADSTANLWPMCCREGNRIVGPAHAKDVLEVRLGRLVCAGKLSLSEAQEAIRRNWIEAAARYPR
jgi:hypothetical protein